MLLRCFHRTLLFSILLLASNNVLLVTSSRQMIEYDLRITEGGLVDGVYSKRTLKIGNGDSVRKDANRFPYSVLIAFRDTSSSRSSQLHVCAGVLFRPQWVLTAGSCMNRVRDVRQLYVGIGDNSPKPEDLLRRTEANLVQDFIIYPNFTGNPRNGADLALIYLREAVENTTIPQFPQNDFVLPGDGTRLVGLGWGVTDVNSNFADNLQVADEFFFMPQENCEAVWHTVNNVTAMIDESVICVRPSNQHVNDASVSICDGDEGGPLIFLDTDSFDINSRFLVTQGRPEVDVVYGIASFGPKKCGDEEFSVFTNIMEYLDWIDVTISTYVPRNPSQTSPSEDHEPMLVVFLGVAAGVLLLLAILIYLRLRSPRRNRSSSVDISSTTILKNATEASRGQHEMARMDLSPFLAAAFTSEENEAGIGEFSLNHETLPMDLKVKLVGRTLGAGGFGRVEEGLYVDPQGVQHKVAVKFVQFGEDESRDSLINEIRILERVGPHPNVVRCFGGSMRGASSEESGYYIVEELMATDLEKFFNTAKQRKKITFRNYLKIFQGTAHGLEHLHKREVIHFDLKPSNILLDESHQPKLADFGCSRKRAQSYITAGARGTVAYMAPELWLLGMYARRGQVRGETIDVFSFGVVMWEALTNRKPIDPLSMQELAIAIDEGAASADVEVTAAGTNEDFRTDRFPFDNGQYPDPLKALIWECVSYYNSLRPTFKEVKERIEELMEMDWIEQNIDHYSSSSS